MMLPSFPTYSQETDVNKQMSQMRNYLNMLKDEIENALSNIGYDQLDADLRKRIDEMGDNIYKNSNEILEVAGTLKAKYITADEIASTYATFGWVSANYATFNWVSSNYASISYLEGNYASFNYVDTYYLSANDASITYATISALTAVDGKFNNLNANNITSGTLTSARLNADDIASTMFQSRTIIANAIQVYGNGGTGIASSTYVSANTFIRCGNWRWYGNVATVKDVNGFSRNVPYVESAT